MNKKIDKKQKRKSRIRAKTIGTNERPRLTVFRSAKHIYAQIVDDQNNKTILGVSEKHLDSQKEKKEDKAKKLGLLLAKKSIDKKIKKVVFDKGSYAYHGRVKSLAQGAREGGLEF
ncbi:50S ribosomal protein L18 [Candidatus Microgenomates bacterium]|nr:MAG: 50S ribosomal protein L18 [Candidatus Microgenomates bacterium]